MSPPPTTSTSTPPTQVQTQAPQTQAQTYIPVPVPVTTSQKSSFGTTLFGLGVLLFVGLLMRFIWRLPERLAHQDWVRRLGGAFGVQNHILHTLGYFCLAAGFFTGQALMGIGVAALLMIASNVRPQGEGEYE